MFGVLSFTAAKTNFCLNILTVRGLGLGRRAWVTYLKHEHTYIYIYIERERERERERSCAQCGFYYEALAFCA